MTSNQFNQLYSTKILMVFLTTFAFVEFDYMLFFCAVLFGWCLFGLVVSVLLHRKISHRLFEFKNNGYKWFFYTLLLLSGHATPIGWASVHRVHHSKTDTKDDPQNPRVVGRIRTFCTLFWLNTPNHKQMVDLLRDRELVFIHKYHVQIFYFYALLFFMIDPMLCFYFAGVSPLVCLILSGVINTFGHDDYSFEGGTMAKDMFGTFIFWGENLHKKHHLHPSSIKYHDYDLGYFFIKFTGQNYSRSL